MTNFFLDLINLEFFVLVLVFTISFILKLKPLQLMLLIFHVITIFLLNDVLFDSNYMGDQRRYLEAAKSVRLFQQPADGFVNSVGISGFLFSIFPIPFIISIQSLSMINFIIYLLLYFFLKKQNILTYSSEIFYLLYPSLLLYSSVGLREMLILTFMIIVVYQFLVRDKYIFSVICSLPLIFLKPQNFLIINMCSTILFFLKKGDSNKKIGILFLIILAFFGLKNLILSRFTIPAGFGFIDVINNYRNYMFFEDTRSYVEGYIPINNFFDLFYQGAIGSFYMLLKPFPWQSGNPLQFVQSIENIIIFFLMVFLVLKPINFKTLKLKANYLKMMIIISMSIYGMVVFNFGSASRYRFGFIVVFFIFYCYILNKNRIDLLKYKSINPNI